MLHTRLVASTTDFTEKYNNVTFTGRATNGIKYHVSGIDS